MRPTFDYKSLSESQNFLAENFDRSSRTLPISQFYFFKFFFTLQPIFIFYFLKNINMFNNVYLKLLILQVQDANQNIRYFMEIELTSQ